MHHHDKYPFPKYPFQKVGSVKFKVGSPKSLLGHGKRSSAKRENFPELLQDSVTLREHTCSWPILSVGSRKSEVPTPKSKVRSLKSEVRSPFLATVSGFFEAQFQFILFALFTNISTLKHITRTKREKSKHEYTSDLKK